MKSKRNFTLLEITVCIALLAICSLTIGWQMKNLVATHYFDKSVKHFFTDLKKCQILALANRFEIVIHIAKNTKGYCYSVHSPDPNFPLEKKAIALKGVEIIKERAQVKEELDVEISSSGRILPQQEIEFWQDLYHKVTFDLSSPLLIELKRSNSV